MSGCTKQRCRPATAEPNVPSTWIYNRSSRLTRLAQDELICARTPPLQLEHREGVILDINVIGRAALVDPARLRGRMAARDGADRAEQAVEDVAPMRKHIQDQAAAGRLLVIPVPALRREEIAINHPLAEIEPDVQFAAE